MIIFDLVLCVFLYLFGDSKSLENDWLASHENMLKAKKKKKKKKSNCFTDITIRTSKCSQYINFVLNTKLKINGFLLFKFG